MRNKTFLNQIQQKLCPFQRHWMHSPESHQQKGNVVQKERETENLKSIHKPNRNRPRGEIETNKD